MKCRLKFTVVILAACTWQHAFAECTVAEIIKPARETTVHDARSDIEWQPLPGVQGYRVQIESRVPEGRVMQRIDTRVIGTHFAPPRPLTEQRATVKLLVTEDCPTGVPGIAERPAWFYVDMITACSVPTDISISNTATAKVTWIRVARATRYVIEVYAADDGRLIKQEETLATSTNLPRAPYPQVVAVSSRCESVIGKPAYGFLPALP